MVTGVEGKIFIVLFTVYKKKNGLKMEGGAEMNERKRAKGGSFRLRQFL